MAISELLQYNNIKDIAYTDDTGEYSYEQLIEFSSKFANYLTCNNIIKGDIIIINITKNSISLPIAILGSIWNGVIPILLGHGKCGAISNRILLSETCKKYNVSMIVDNIDLEQLASYDRIEETANDNLNNCVIFVSSGTMGHPKYISHHFDKLLDSAKRMKNLLIHPTDRSIICMELLSHAYGFVIGFCMGLYSGLTTHLSSSLNESELLEKTRPDIFSGTPRHFINLSSKSFPYVRLAVSAGFSPLYKLTGAEFVDGYGCTETLSFVLANGNVVEPYTVNISDEGYLVINTPEISIIPGDLFSYEDGNYKFIKRGK